MCGVRSVSAFAAVLACCAATGGTARAAPETRCVDAELFVMPDCPHSPKAKADLEARPGLKLRIHDVVADPQALRRFYALAEKHGVKPGVPMFHACEKIVVGYVDRATTGPRYDELLTVEVFTRAGCPHCAAAKTFLAAIGPRYPGLRITVVDAVASPEARRRWEELNRLHGIRAPGLPTFRLCGRLHVGFLTPESTGAMLTRILDSSTVPCADDRRTDRSESSVPPFRVSTLFSSFVSTATAAEPMPDADGAGSERPRDGTVESAPPPGTSLPPPPGGGASLPPPLPSGPDASAPPLETPGDDSAPSAGGDAPSEEQSVDLPVFGRIDVRRLGMPLFTIAVGLVDGFNPCAMWVLLFLLSILVNLGHRGRILAVAGTFVVVSGLAYFAFMAAWLNVFRLIGYRRWAEVLLGLLAVGIGAVHVKDFFAFKKGLSLSIPESAKPGIYARVRGIVTARNMTGAIAGASVLAVLVNLVELLCTAGLPALYTRILTLQDHSALVEYAYLALYIAAYMADDTLMVALVVVTLGRRKLQERQGRWLKLASGTAILALGLVMLFAPQWLV